MGKKSRRQREKDPRGTGLRKVLRHALTADTPLSNLSPQELKKLANDVLDSQDPTRAHNDDDGDEPAPPPLSGVDNAKIILVQVMGGIGRQDVLDANFENQLRLLTDEAALAYAQYVRGQDPRVLWGLGPGLQAWLLEGISNGAKRDDDDDSELDAVQDAAPAASKPTVAEAEAEYRAAMSPAGWNNERFHDAMMSLRAALTIDEDDQNNFDAYMGIVSPPLCVPEDSSELTSIKLLKAMKRWPRIRKYWPRLRRRICWGCGKQYDLSEPRLWVCSGCDDARYCDEACQAADWPKHQSSCLEKMMGKLELEPGVAEAIRRLEG